MNPIHAHAAFGAPRIEPRWTSSAKEGLGTSYHTSCRVWFTLSHGIANEIYFPTVDPPNTRDFQFLISDGKTFCYEEKRDFEHRIDYPDRDCLSYRLTTLPPNAAKLIDAPADAPFTLHQDPADAALLQSLGIPHPGTNTHAVIVWNAAGMEPHRYTGSTPLSDNFEVICAIHPKPAP